MTFKELIDKLKEFHNGSDCLLKLWLDELKIHKETNYQNIYGFVRGLYAVNFISEEDEDSLIKLLLNLYRDY